MNAGDVAEPSDTSHPLDVTSLVEEGRIQAASVGAGTFAMDCDVVDGLFTRLKLKPVDQAVYLQFYRHSYGRGLNCAQVSTAQLCRLCNISHATARKTVHTLCAAGCLQQIRSGIQHDPPIYRVMLPGEMPNCQAARRHALQPLPRPLPGEGTGPLTFAMLSEQWSNHTERQQQSR